VSARGWFGRALYTAAITLLAAAAASGGVLAWRTINPPSALIAVTHAPAPDAGAELTVGERRPDFTLPDLDGTPRSVAEWDGRLLFVNFWATWCPPCLEEIPTFVRLQQEFGPAGAQFLGIAVDSAENVQRFAADHGMNYPSLVGQAEGIELTRRFGNRIGALPYTVVVGRDGNVLVMHHGILHEDQVRELIARHL